MIHRLADTHEEMQRAVGEPEVGLYYLPYHRSYLVLSVDPGARPCDSLADDHRLVIESGFYIHYCPWSGRRLPEGLFDEWETGAVEQYGLE